MLNQTEKIMPKKQQNPAKTHKDYDKKNRVINHGVVSYVSVHDTSRRKLSPWGGKQPLRFRD